MQSSSKKNITVHSKNQSQHPKGIKRSKSTEQLMPKKPAKKPSCDTKQSLSKSKSTKSLKGKSKLSTASECSSKKTRPKKSLKTVKKGKEGR